MIPVQLVIESTIDQEEKILQEMEGQFVERGEEWVLRYVEHPGSEDEIRTTVKAEQHKATVIRQGAITYRQTYSPGKRTFTRIEMPGGTAEMEVNTLDYQRRQTGEQGELSVSFLLEMGGEQLGNYQLQIKWFEVSNG